MESSAGCVIIGAGIVGCSVAEHLSRLGWRDVVVLDQGPLFEAGGSTSHAPGLMFQTNPSKTMTDLARYSVGRYVELEVDGEPCGYQVGGMEVAETPERWRDLERKHGLATSWGLESELISPQECAERVPILDPGKIRGGFYVPTDGIAKAVRACEAMARLAGERGAKFYGETEVTGIEVKDGRVRSVETDRGRVETDLVVSCAGMWGPRIGRMVGMNVPLVPMQHQYAWTTPLEELAGETREVVHPILRHQDFSMYFRQSGDHYGIGTYRHRPMPVSVDDIKRDYRGEGEFPSVWEFTPEDFESSWQEARKMLPALERAEIERPMNGLFSFTPDGGPLLGESREAQGFWIAEAVWITHAVGVGKVMAEWITDGVAEHGPQRRRRPPLRALRPEPCLRPGPQRAVVPRGLRHHPPPAADGGAAPPAGQPLLPAPAGARGRTSSRPRLGAAAMVRGQRVAARGARGSGPRRVGRAVLVADRRRRSPGHPRARRPSTT